MTPPCSFLPAPVGRKSVVILHASIIGAARRIVSDLAVRQLLMRSSHQEFSFGQIARSRRGLARYTSWPSSGRRWLIHGECSLASRMNRWRALPKRRRRATAVVASPDSSAMCS